jgi:hypothetical protein
MEWTTERIVAIILLFLLCAILVWKAYSPEEIYLSDISFEVLQGAVDFEPITDAGRAEQPIQILNTTYKKGLTVKANSEIRTRFIPQGYRFFATEIGVDGTVPEGSNASVIFQIMADGSLLYESPVLTQETPPHFVRVCVEGRHELLLQVLDAGDGNENDFAHWARCRFEYQ